MPFLGIFMLKHALFLFCAGASLLPAAAQTNPKTHPPVSQPLPETAAPKTKPPQQVAS